MASTFPLVSKQAGQLLRVGVIGVSARAAVQSLARAGYSAWAIDLFGDTDLRQLADVLVCPVDDYPHGLVALAARHPPSPFLYTGGLENHSEILATLMTLHELWGNDPEVVQQVRDPWLLASRFPEAFPCVVPTGEACPKFGSWLSKPLHSGGGLGIRWAEAGEAASGSRYFQEYVAGVSASAVCLDGRCLGVTRQWHGRRWLHATNFIWCGNLGPWTDDPEVVGFCRRWCRRLYQTFGLRGIWGFDLIRGRREIRIVEINPRYPAATEVLEWAYSMPILDGWPAERAEPPCCVGKAIYYAPRDLVFPENGPWQTQAKQQWDPWRWSSYADIPPAGTRISQGRPVLTLLARRSTLADCVRELRRLAADLDHRLLAID